MRAKTLKQMSLSTRKLFVSIGLKGSAKKGMNANIFISFKKTRFQCVATFCRKVIARKGMIAFTDM